MVLVGRVVQIGVAVDFAGLSTMFSADSILGELVFSVVIVE